MQARSRSAVFDPEERKIVHFMGFGHAATHYIELVYPTLAVALAAETGLPLADVLSWSFASYLLFGLGSLPAGFAADRLGSRRVVLAGLTGAGLSALAASFAAPGWPIALCLAGLGASASCYHPAGTGLLSRAVVARGRALGVNGIYGNVGIALAPLATATLAEAYGWRATLAITGSVLLAVTAAFARLKIREPGSAPTPDVAGPDPERADRATLAASDATDPPPPIGPGGSMSPAMPESASGARTAASASLGAFAALCVAAALGGFAYRGSTTAQPALFAESIHFIGYGVAASLAMLVGIGGQYLGGLVADHRELRTAYLAFHMASLPMLAAIAISTGAPLLFASALYVFFALGMQPIENSLFASLTPDRWRSTAYGFKFTMTFGIGSTAVWMVRGVAEAYDWAAVYSVLFGVVAVLVGFILLMIFLPRREAIHNHTPQPAHATAAAAVD